MCLRERSGVAGYRSGVLIQVQNKKQRKTSETGRYEMV